MTFALYSSWYQTGCSWQTHFAQADSGYTDIRVLQFAFTTAILVKPSRFLRGVLGMSSQGRDIRGYLSKQRADSRSSLSKICDTFHWTIRKDGFIDGKNPAGCHMLSVKMLPLPDAVSLHTAPGIKIWDIPCRAFQNCQGINCVYSTDS